ncbi:MAG: Amidase enhancer precursor [Firmicutes bacterium ADurb.Bin248]|nr:MAG: Amidase enhancer precursor [Firmicutes bacterium ADurb.Bin248]
MRAGAIRAINTLPVEQYLYGVLPHEMSNSFPVDALKAQAVCARSFAMARCSRYSARDYDLVDTSKDQVYAGYASKNLRAIAAVDATAGQVLTYEGDIIEAFYTSSNGGQTERSANVWSEDYPYYVNVDDPFDLMNPSSIEYEAFIPARYTDASVAAMDRDVYAALLRGAYEAAGAAVELVSTVRVRPHTSDYEAPSRCYLFADVTLAVKKPDGGAGQLTVTLALKDFAIGASKYTLGAIGASTYSMRMRGAERAEREIGGQTYAGWNLTVRRYGHGVGLSQRGAQQRARAGQGFEEILAFYYPGAALTTAGTWESAPRISSDRYTVKAWGVSGVEPDTSPDKLLSRLTCEGELSLVTAKGDLKIESLATTGNFVRVSYDGGKCLFDLPVVIYGDLDGEPGITEDDAKALAEHLMRARTFTGAFLEAADVNRDGGVDAGDLLLLLRSLQGDDTISQKG